MNTNAYIGVDLGGESGRVIVGSFDGQKIQLEEKHRFKTGGIDFEDSLRWNVTGFFEEILHGLSVAATSNKSIISVGVDTWGVDYVLLDCHDEILELPFHYRDRRNAGMLDAVTGQIGKEKIFSQTGIQFMEINTLYQLAAHRRAGDSLDRAKHFLTIPDYFHWSLCGSKSVEFTNATTTQCFDPSTRTWAKPMLTELGIPTDIFPETVEPGTNLGPLREFVSAKTGLGEISVVAPATHDTGSAVVAIPVNSSEQLNWAYISSGTWSLVGIETDHPVLSAEALAANVTNEGGADGTWRLLKNVMGLWIVQQTREAFLRRGFEKSYEELAAMAKASPSPGVYIDPDDPSFLNPADMEHAVMEFFQRTQQALPGDEAGLIRSILESLALRYCQVLSEIENLSGRAIDVVHVVGGGSQNNLLNQLIADASGKLVVAGPVEATVLGNILIQCKAAGELGSLAEIREVVGRSTAMSRFEPLQNNTLSDSLPQFESICKTQTCQS